MSVAVMLVRDCMSIRRNGMGVWVLIRLFMDGGLWVRFGRMR